MLQVLRPDVPTAAQIAPYLARIDAAKWYSNTGPLVREFEERTGGVTVSSATLGLEIVAPLVFRRRRVRVPAFTFAATITALVRAGFQPVFCDVDEKWGLVDPDEDSLSVCPFGAPVRHGGLVDAAAAWGNQTEGTCVYSLHATKALPAGEGGLVIGPPELMARVRRLANFGFENTPFAHGIVTEAGTNAKMSEYHAAVALAALDRWQTTKRWRQALEAAYRERLSAQFQLQDRPAEGVYTAFPVLVPDAAAVARRMAELQIETRRWYCPTAERHPAFSECSIEGDLRRTRQLNAQLLCLPFHADMRIDDVDRVCEALAWAVGGHRPSYLSSDDLCGEARPYA